MIHNVKRCRRRSNVQAGTANLTQFFIQGREEQAEPDGMEEVTKAAKLIGVDGDFFVDTFMKPKLKVIKTAFQAKVLASLSSLSRYHPNHGG